jgi:hypothetical protein
MAPPLAVLEWLGDFIKIYFRGFLEKRKLDISLKFIGAIYRYN